MVGRFLPVYPGVAFRTLLPEIESLHDAGVSGTAVQSAVPVVSDDRFDSGVYLYEDFGAPFRRRDSDAVGAGLGLSDDFDSAGDRDGYLYDYRRIKGGYLYRPVSVIRSHHGRRGSDDSRPRSCGRLYGAARGAAAGLFPHDQARERSSVSVGWDDIRDDDSGHLVLVYGSVDRAKDAQRQGSGECAKGQFLLRGSEDSAGIHPGAAGADCEGSISECSEWRQCVSDSGAAAAAE